MTSRKAKVEMELHQGVVPHLALGTNNQNICNKLANWVGIAEEKKDKDILATRWKSLKIMGP